MDLLKIRFLYFILFFVSVSVFAKINTQQEVIEDPAKIKQTLTTLQNQIKKLEKKVYQDKHQEKTFHKQLALIEKEIGERSESLRSLDSRKIHHEKTLARLQSESLYLKQTSKSQQEALTQLIQVTFQQYRKEKLRLLLEQHDWSSLARVNQYYQFFYLARAKQIKELQTHLTHIQLLQDKIKQEQSFMAEIAQKLKSEQMELQQKKEERKNILSSLSDKLASDQQVLDQLQSQEQHLEELFKTLQKKLTKTSTFNEPSQHFSKMKKKLNMPVQEEGATLSVLPHVKNAKSKKTYIQAQAGTPVGAIFDGRVVFAEWLRGVGLLIIVDHGNGYMSLYGNNQKLYKGLGDVVKQGEMIARVGQSGGHAEPGLYFEIRKDGEALDPTQWLKS